MKNTTKEKVLDFLRKNSNKYISGQEIADRIYVTRAAVWKAIKAIQADGYNIDAVTNKGYRLLLEAPVLDEETIRHLLITRYSINLVDRELLLYEEVDSTNNIARQYAEAHYGKESVVVAMSQTSGRGRRGREFFSPKGTGIYISFSLKPDTSIAKSTEITCIVACAVCRAIEEITGISPFIKWVNDIFVNNKKVAGILTEGVTSLETGELAYIVTGVGINVYEPIDGFPKEIAKTAGAIVDRHGTEDVLNELCASVIYHFYECMNVRDEHELIDEYRNRSMLIGNYVKVSQYGEDVSSKGYAYVMGIDDEYHLCVRYDNGTEEALSTGEVSVVKY